PTCGITGNAVASDCQALLDSNFTLNYKRRCSTTTFRPYNPVCSPGNCCIYTTSNTLSVDQVRAYGREVFMKCHSAKKNRINGRIIFACGEKLCI
ncbi:hypothetical protein BD779DRAFT_1416241, partial [Infundibulicybe gibba]